MAVFKLMAEIANQSDPRTKSGEVALAILSLIPKLETLTPFN